MDNGMMRKYLPAGLLLAGFALVFSTRSQVAVPLAGSLTTVLPEWSGLTVKEQTITDEERKVAGMSDYVARSYWKDSTVAFTTYVGYYDRQAQGKSMHSPRNCLPGAGWEILSTGSGTIAAGGKQHVVNKYLLKNNNLQAVVFYWYQGRGRVVASEYAVKWNLLQDAAFKGHTEEALVRVMVPVIGAGKLTPADLQRALADAEKLGAEVGARVLSDVGRVLPNTDTGSATALMPTGALQLASSAY